MTWEHSMEERCYTDEQLAERWQITRMTLWRMRQRGVLRSFKFGNAGPNRTTAAEVARVEAGKGE